MVDLEAGRGCPDLFLDGGALHALAGNEGADHRQAFRGGQIAHSKRDGNVLCRRQMRIERVGLEHHGDVAVGGMRAGYVAACKLDTSLIRVVETGENAQQCALAATRRPDEGDEFALRSFDGNAIEDAVASIGFADVAKDKRAHWLASSVTFSPSPVWCG